MQSVPLLFVALAGFGIVAALFGPIKYGILPVHLDIKELSAGNALIEGATFIAILLGTIVGGLAAAQAGEARLLAVLVIALAVVSWLSARMIPSAPSAAPNLTVNRNPAASTIALLAELKSTRGFGPAASSPPGSGSSAPPCSRSSRPSSRNGWGEANTSTSPRCCFSPSASPRVRCLRPAPAACARTSRWCRSRRCSWRSSRSISPGSQAASPPPRAEKGIADLFGSISGLRLIIDLSGLAIAGGLFIVPAFSAVQAEAPEDRRARVIAACNVLAAGFMTLASLAVALAQYVRIGPAAIFAVLGLGCFVACALILRAWGNDGIKDVGVFLFKTFFGLEVKGLENLPKKGEKAIIAPNHVSLLDAALMHALLPSHAAYAVDTGMANTWWVKPFLKLVDAFAIDPTKPLGTRHLIQTVKEGRSLVIFPEGRLTVTGGLMKVYDGTAMIADKAAASVIPVRIDGLERSHFGYLSKAQTRKAWFPKTTVTILPPEKIAIDPALKGKTRRLAAGLALQDIMTDSAVLTAPIDMSLFEALVLAKKTRDTGRPVIEDPLGGRLSYKKLIVGAQVLGAKIAPLAPEGAAVGVLLAQLRGRRRDVLRAPGHRPRARHAELHRRPGERRLGLQGRESRRCADVADVRPERPSRSADRRTLGDGENRLSRGRARHDHVCRQGAWADRRRQARCRRRPERAGGDPLHLRIGRHAQGRRALAPQFARELRPEPDARCLQWLGQGVQRAPRLPFVRADRGSADAGNRRHSGLSLSDAIALPHHSGTRLRLERHDPVRHGHVPLRLRPRRASLRLRARCVSCSQAPKR